MTANEVHLIYFSPTHTSKQVGEAIVRGTGITNVINTNLTQQATQDLVIAESALAIIVVPVYGGRVALWPWIVWQVCAEVILRRLSWWYTVTVLTKNR